MGGGDVDLEVEARAHAAETGDLERDDERIGDRGPRLEPARERDYRDAISPRGRRQLAAGGGDDPPGAERARGLVSRQRLLGVAGVARA